MMMIKVEPSTVNGWYRAYLIPHKRDDVVGRGATPISAIEDLFNGVTEKDIAAEKANRAHDWALAIGLFIAMLLIWMPPYAHSQGFLDGNFLGSQPPQYQVQPPPAVNYSRPLPQPQPFLPPPR